MIKLLQNEVSTYCELPNLPVVYQVMLCLRGDGVSQSLCQERGPKAIDIFFKKFEDKDFLKRILDV